MSIVFFGAPAFAVPSLAALLKSGETVSLVVTQSDKAKGRGHILSAPPVKTAALEAGLPIVQPARMKDRAFLDTLASLEPECIAVVAYGKILPKEILEMPRLGCINVHASLLPKYRGAAPISWAIIRGEEKTGVTTMRMDEGLDTGPVLLAQDLMIGKEDTAGSLGATLSELGAKLLVETVRRIRDGSVIPRAQAGEATFAPPLKKEDGLIDWERSAVEIFNFVRGMNPWPVAHCRLGDEALRILKAEPVPGIGRPGIVEKADVRELVVGTGNGLLSIIELQPPGKRPMSATSFLQGRRLTKGQALR
ncbi:MAG TPA: methionyl-tRNA formyltransferase [Thermodesulfovibrionales bacterium]|nr:methionyl-tRNA formyltransferase [Thermodesulfovibrionales bacterium]